MGGHVRCQYSHNRLLQSMHLVVPHLLQWSAVGWPLAWVQTQCAGFAAGHRALGRTCTGRACGGRRMGQAADSSPATEGPAQAAAREQASLAAAEF